MGQGIVIGPMITEFGFRSWFWGCRPSMLVAVPGGFWVAIGAATATAGITGVVGAVAAAKGGTGGNKTVDRIHSATDEALAAMTGTVVYRCQDLGFDCVQAAAASNQPGLRLHHEGWCARSTASPAPPLRCGRRGITGVLRRPRPAAVSQPGVRTPAEPP